MTAPDVEFDDAVLGRGLAPEVEALIAEAGRLNSAPQLAEPLLIEAQRRAPDHPAPWIALYRFHFYGHRLQAARAIAQRALVPARAALGPELDLRALDLRCDAAARFYLFLLKGYAYLSLRLGEHETGRQALDELRRLDPQDFIGGAVLARVLARWGREDDGDVVVPPAGPRGWDAAEP